MIKKLLFVFVILFFVLLSGCENGTTGSAFFAPPAWIIGEWKDSGSVNVFEFSSDNIIYTTASGAIDFKSTFSSAAITEDVKSDTEYRLAATAGYYRFVYKTSTTLDYYASSSGSPIELTKQSHIWGD